MPTTEILVVIAVVIVIYIIYIIAISKIRKDSSKIVKQINEDKAKRQKQLIAEKIRQEHIETKPCYQLKSSVKPLKEKYLNDVLTRYCKNNNLILSTKVKLTDFLDPIVTKYVGYDDSRRRAKSVYVDFLISSSKKFEPLAAVLLDEQWIEDTSVEEILEEAKLKVFCFDDLDEDRITFDLDYYLEEKIQYIRYL